MPERTPVIVSVLVKVKCFRRDRAEHLGSDLFALSLIASNVFRGRLLAKPSISLGVGVCTEYPIS